MTTTNDATPLVSHPIGRRGTVTVRLPAADIRLTGTDGDRVVVRTPNGRSLPDRVTVEATETGLTIREREVFGLTFAVGRKTVQLDIELPAEADVTIETASGSLESVGLRGEQHFRTASGDMQLRAAAGRIEINSVSGDVELDLAGSAELVVKSVSGDVAVAGGELGSLRVGTTSGDIRIDSPITGRSGNQIDTLSGDVSLVAEAGMRVEAKTVSGDLTTDLPHRSEGRMGRRALVVGDGSIEVSFRSVSGDLQIIEARGESGSIPAAPRPPEPPVAPTVPPFPGAERPAEPDPAEADRLTILRALESGELDVATAMERLAALDDDATGKEASDA